MVSKEGKVYRIPKEDVYSLVAAKLNTDLGITVVVDGLEIDIKDATYYIVNIV